MRLILALLLPSILAADFSGSDGRAVRNAVCLSEGVLYVGGDFESFGGKPRPGLAALNVDSGQVLEWSPKIGGAHVSAILEMDGLVYLGGCGPKKEGGCDGFLIAVDKAGRVMEGWDPRPDKAVAALERGPDGSLYVGGRFTQIAGSPRAMLAQVSGARQGAASALPFQPRLSHRVTTLAFDGKRLLAGGFFPGLLAAFSADGASLPLPINIEGTQSKEILRMIRHQGRLYVAGVEITAVSGQPRSNAFALDARTLALLPWRADLDAGAGALSAWGGTVYLGGDFRTVSGEPCRLAALDAETGALKPLAFQPDHNTYALQAFEGGYFASGYWQGFSALFHTGPRQNMPLLSNLVGPTSK